MLKLEHIMRIKIEQSRLLAHRGMPPPVYSVKELTSQISAIGETAITGMLNIPTDIFKLQLEAARELGASYIMEDSNRNSIGISAATSLIKDNDVLKKNVIVPENMTWYNPKLKEHYIIGVFINGKVVDGIIPDVNEITIAGWTDLPGLRRAKSNAIPMTFRSKLPVVAMPCADLNPISTLLDRLSIAELCV